MRGTGHLSPAVPAPRLSCSVPPARVESQSWGAPVGKAESRRADNGSLAPLLRPRHCPPKAILLTMHLWDRTAAPFSRQESTAGIEGRAAGDVVTGDIPLCGAGV